MVGTVTQFKRGIEDIRVTSTSIHEVVARLVALWGEHGIKVKFTSYPSTFSTTVSNSHNSPAGYAQNWIGEAHLPRGYPGWAGSWKGVIEVMDSNSWPHTPYFSNLINGEVKGLPPVPWLKTGSGGGGDSFSYSGMLFLYDFPVMHEQFKQTGEEFKVLEVDYGYAVKHYAELLKTQRTKYVINSELHLKAQALYDQAKKEYKKAEDMLEKTHTYLIGGFNDKYDVEPPLPNSMFTDDLETTKALTLKATEKTPPPNLSATYSYIEDLAAKIGDYMKNNPEVFI